MKLLRTTTIALLMCAAVIAFASRASAEIRPNIILFYVDDLGWQGTQINDVDSPCPYETPNVVKLAAQGMNFTQAYSAAPTCAPSRAGILTGQHPGKLRYTHVTFASIPKGRWRSKHPIVRRLLRSMNRVLQSMSPMLFIATSLV